MPQLQPIPSILAPPTTPSRGRQLRDLTIDALELFKAEGVQPLKELIGVWKRVQIFTNSADDPAMELASLRLESDILKEMTSYCVPKLKSVEHTGEINTGITVVIGGIQPKDHKTLNLPKTSVDLLPRPPDPTAEENED